MWCFKFIASIVYLTLRISSAAVNNFYDAELDISLAGIVPGLKNSEIYNASVALNRSSSLTLNVKNLSSQITFLIIQAHSHEKNITLSYNPFLNKKNHVNGTNLGLVYERGDTKAITLMNLDVFDAVDVYISIHAYIEIAPIPGGCNMENNILNAAYMTVWYNEDVTTVETFPARVESRPDCDILSQAIRHDYYHFFMNENDHSSEEYFESLKKMITVEAILKHGSLVPKYFGYAQLRRLFSTYPRIGSIYVVVATYKNQSSAYVPVHTYACADTGSCSVPGYVKFFYGSISLTGLVVCILGHWLFRFQLFLFGLVFGTVMSYMLILPITALSYTGSLSVSSVILLVLLSFWYAFWRYSGVTLKSVICCTIFIGLCLLFIHKIGLSAVFIMSLLSGTIMGSLWLMTWSYSGVPLCPIILVTLCLGFHVASIIYFGFPDGQILLENDVNFWALFVCIILMVTLLCLPLAHYGNILACAVVGAYAAILPFDLLGSQLRFILINVIRRGSIENFNNAVIDPPFQWRDGLIVLLWAALAILGCFVQFWLTRGRAPFPPHYGSVLGFNPPTSSRDMLQTPNFFPSVTSAPPPYTESEETPLFPDLTKYRRYV